MEEEDSEKSGDEQQADVESMEYVKPKVKSGKKVKKCKVQVSDMEPEGEFSVESSSSVDNVVVKKKKLQKEN